jgi:hypothetical protein
LSSIPFISTGIVGCQLTPPTPIVSADVLRKLGLLDVSWPFYTLLIVPGYLAIFYSTTLIIFMLFRMWKVDQQAQKWSRCQPLGKFERKRKRHLTALTKLRREVFHQCVQYLVAVYLTWLLYLTAALEAEKFITSHYGLWIVIFFLSGIQGFLNCMIYFRPRISRYLKNRSKQNQRRNRQSHDLIPSEVYPARTSWTSYLGRNRTAQAEPAVDVITAFAALAEALDRVNVRRRKSLTQNASGPDDKIINMNTCEDVMIQNNNLTFNVISNVDKHEETQ